MALNIVDESTLTVSGASIGLSSASPTLAVAQTSGARQAVITVLTAPVCYHQDGGDATTADPILTPGDILNVLGDSMRNVLTNLRFIRLGSTDGALVIRWYDRDVINVAQVTRGTKGSRIITPTTGTGTTLANLTPGAAFHLLGVRIHIGSALASAETLTITNNSGTATAYDTVLFTLDMGTPDIRDVVIPFGGDEDFFGASDVIDIVLSANTGGDTFGCETIHELV